MSIVNIAAYKFVSLDDLPGLRERLRERCESAALKGTILLAPEGINLFLAGDREGIDTFLAHLRADLRFADMAVKESLSDSVPFGRLRVRLKREIISMRQPTIQPEGGRAPAVDAPTLQRWLASGRDDAGRDVVLLDTRNDYEIARGRFTGAVDYGLANFTAFPAAIAADRARYTGKTVVSYCTGGIRCEKAALHMQALGMDHVYQLDGGILKYLEETDGTHWQGDCFVFDGRGAVDKRLRPTLPPEASGDDAESKPELLPLPHGERAGERGGAGDEADSQCTSLDFPASTRPSSAPAGHLLPKGEKGVTA
ncbi:MAG: sulfurtransferase [Rhodanobacter sp.]